jgi:ATP-dependent Lon protease
MEIPLFPLPNLVLFPQVLVPLHIFEERYKLMINACIENDEVFGVVLLREGAESESEDAIHRVGVTARVVQVERLADGRMNILTQAENRFRIRRFTQETPYWKGFVEFWDDDESRKSTESLYNEVSELYKKFIELSTKIDSSEETESTIPESPSDLSFVISYVLDIDSETKQKLLEMTSSAERLRALIPLVNEAIRKIEQQIALNEMMHKVRGNGDLGKPKGL